MDDGRRDDARTRNDELRDQIDSLLGTFEQQQRDLAEAQSTLAAATVTAWSSDNLVRVVSNAAGVPTEVHVEPTAFKQSTPAKLSQSITEAVQAAARQALATTQQAIAPMQQAAAGLPDLSDLVPGAPSIRHLIDTMFPAPAGAPQEPSVPPEDEDDYYRNRSYLQDRP